MFTILVLLFVWVYVASCFGGDGFQNFYVNRVRKLLARPVTYLQGIAPKCPEWAAAVLLFALLLMLSCALSKAAANPKTFAFGRYVFTENIKSFPAAAVFTFAGFAIFLCKLNVIRLALSWRYRMLARQPVVDALDTATLPLSKGSLNVSAIVTVVAVSGATLLLVASAQPGLCINGGDVVNADGMRLTAPFALGVVPVLKLMVLAAVDVIALFRDMLILLIFVSIGGMIAGNRAVMGMANEWLDTLTRTIAKNPIRYGMMDFTPLIIYVACGFVHGFLVNFIRM